MKSRVGIVTSLLVIGFGVGWLLDSLDIFKTIDWAGTIFLGLAGILVLLFGGLNKVTIVLGPMMIAGSITWVLRRLGHLEFNEELPILTITFGVLLLIAFVSKLRMPEFFKETAEGPPDDRN